MALDPVSLTNRARNAENFANLARIIARSNGSIAAAQSMASELATDRLGVQSPSEKAANELRYAPASRILAAAVDIQTTDTLSTISEYQTLSTAFLSSMRSAFDILRNASLQLPAKSKIAVYSGTETVSAASEAQAKAVLQLSLGSEELTPSKAHALVVITDELARSSGNAFERILRNSVTKAADAALIDALIDTATPSVTGSSNFLSDLASAVAQISVTADSNLFALAPANVIAALALTPASGTNSLRFPDLTVNGGNVGGVQLIPTPALTTDSSGAGDVVVVDASKLATWAGGIELSSSRNAIVQLETTPDNPTTASTVMLSLWQRNLLGLIAERWLAVAKLSTDAAVVIEGGSYVPGE